MSDNQNTKSVVAPKLEGRITLPFKIKDKPGHDKQAFRLKDVFGFVPETIVIIAAHDQKNTFQLFAEFTPEELAKGQQKK